MDKSRAHVGHIPQMFADKYPEGLVEWHEAIAPNLEEGHSCGVLRGCGYCGSMNPTDLAAAILAGAVGHFADMKYGWPHKVYFENVPNPHAGMLEHRSTSSRYSEQTPIKVKDWYYSNGKPAPDTTHATFYTIHLMDATTEEREIIEHHLGVKFTFEGNSVLWGRYE